MVPTQEQKLEAQRLADRNYRLGRCFTCNGIGCVVPPAEPIIKCSVCAGTGKRIESVRNPDAA